MSIRMRILTVIYVVGLVVFADTQVAYAQFESLVRRVITKAAPVETVPGAILGRSSKELVSSESKEVSEKETATAIPGADLDLPALPVAAKMSSPTIEVDPGFRTSR